MHINIRKAIEADCPAILQLIKELAIYEKAGDEVTVTLNQFTQCGFGATAMWQAFVAESDDVIIGVALYYPRFSTWKGPRLYLEDLVVTDAMRGQGIGKLLLNKLIAECKLLQYTGIAWQVLNWNEPGLHFYKKYDGLIQDDEWINCSLTV